MLEKIDYIEIVLTVAIVCIAFYISSIDTRLIIHYLEGGSREILAGAGMQLAISKFSLVALSLAIILKWVLKCKRIMVNSSKNSL